MPQDESQKTVALRCILAIAIVHTAAILAFTGGFLLTRVQLPSFSGPSDAASAALSWRVSNEPACSNSPPHTPTASIAESASKGNRATAAEDDAQEAFKSGLPHYRKTVVMIIDALRYDFVLLPNTSNPGGSAAASHTRQMPLTRRLLHSAVRGAHARRSTCCAC